MNFDQKQQPVHVPHGVPRRHAETSFVFRKNKYRLDQRLPVQTNWVFPNPVWNQNMRLVFSDYHKLEKSKKDVHFRVLRAAN